MDAELAMRIWEPSEKLTVVCTWGKAWVGNEDVSHQLVGTSQECSRHMPAREQVGASALQDSMKASGFGWGAPARAGL